MSYFFPGRKNKTENFFTFSELSKKNCVDFPRFFKTFWKKASNYIYTRKEDNILILPPNRIYKINDSGIRTIEFLKGRNSLKKLKFKNEERFFSLINFLKTLMFYYDYENNSKYYGDFPVLETVPFDFNFNRLPVLGEIAVTYRCNNKCLFCYAGCNNSAGSGTAKRLEMVDYSTGDLKKIIKVFKEEAKIPFFSFTGGEPLLRKDLNELISYSVKNGLIVNLVTNGTFATKKCVAGLYKAGLRTAQVSIESAIPEEHDFLTGRKGAFHETLEGIKNLKSGGISVQTNTTINSLNKKSVFNLPDFLYTLGIDTFAMNMYIPSGTGLSREELFISYEEIGSIVDEIKKKAQKLGMTFYWYSPTPYCIYNPISSGLGNKSCAAFDSLISVAPNGDVLPCSSWDESMGNLLKQDFKTIWFSARGDYFRNKHFAPPECSGCQAFIPCQGACPLYWKVKSSTVLNSCKKEVKK